MRYKDGVKVGTTSKHGLSVVRVVVQAANCQDSGIGIVIARHPLTLLVPSHVIELVSEGRSKGIQINGVNYENAKILPAQALQRDHLSVLQFPKRTHRDLSPAHLPKRGLLFTPGQPISLQRVSSESSASGRVVDVREHGQGKSIITDIEVSTGDSGSPLLVSGKLAAICQGMIQNEGSGNAVAVPLSSDSLAELKRVGRRHRVSVVGTLLAIFMTAFLSLVGFALYSSTSFTLAGVEVSQDGNSVTATNAQAITLHSSWTKPFYPTIRESLALASKTGGNLDRVAIGTNCGDDVGGSFTLLDSRGHQRWSYAVPNGECIYSTETVAYNNFLVGGIYTADLNQDGHTELLVTFMHDHFFPCKLVVFSMAGDILAEFWHPGYIRTIVASKVAESDDILVIASASNNRLKTDFWNPQTLFAFRGLDISGQAPPYTGTSGSPSELAPSHELWTWVIVNVDPLLKRAICSSFNIVDTNGDGIDDIQAVLSDGRFYNLSESGEVLSVDWGDRYDEMFPDGPVPALVELWDYIEKNKPDTLR